MEKYPQNLVQRWQEAHLARFGEEISADQAIADISEMTGVIRAVHLRLEEIRSHD